MYFTKNMETYLGASYQNDFLEEISENYNVFPYGPGYNYFKKKLDFNDICKISNKKIDLVIFGHTFLSDQENKYTSIIPNLNIYKIKNIPKIFVLNKEYVNLKFKLNFIKENNFNLCITHHHEFKKYEEFTNSKFIFLPFAIKKDIFSNIKSKNKIYDIFFSGILQNKNKLANQNDTRIKVMNKFFVSFNDIPFYKKKKYRNLNIYWNSIPRGRIQNMIIQNILKRKRLSYSDYTNVMHKSKIVLNTLSPVKLVSPRYFETMASKAVVLCEKNSIYKEFINEEYLVSFDNNLLDFDSRLNFAIELSQDKIYLDKMFKYVLNNHTWKNRINLLKSHIDIL